MTVSTAIATIAYAGDGSTVALSVPFYFLQNSHLQVVQNNTLVIPPTSTTLVLGTGYNVSGAGNEAGGTVTLTAPAPVGTNTVITRNVPATQLIHYVPNDDFPASTHEQALDQLTMLAQQILIALGYVVTLPPSTGGTGISAELPYPLPSQFLAWDPTGTFITNASPTGIGPGTVVDALVAPAAAIQSTKLAYLQGSTGSITRTIYAKMSDVMSVLDFAGVDPTGSTDSTAGIQAAINACTGTLLFPAGNYLCGAVSITHALLLQGEGSTDPSAGTGSVIVHNSTTTNVFTVNTQYPVYFRDLVFLCPTTPTAGASITYEDTTPTQGVANLFSGVFNCRFDNVFIGIYAVSASSWDVTNCQFWTIPANGIGIQIDNQYNKDQGDQCISGCTFNGANTGIGIYWLGGGGTRIITNKFLMANAIWAQFANATATATAQFVIANNSIDVPNYASAIPVQLLTSSGTKAFQNILITGNIFIGYFAMTNMLNITGFSTAVISYVTVVGNNFINAGGSFSGSGMIVMNYVTSFLIAHNFIYGPGSGNGVTLGANCVNGSVVANEIQNFANTVVNTGTTCRVRGLSNSGVTASVADGGTITHNLGVTPTKILVTGGTAAQTYTVFNLTSTQFSVSVRNTAGASGTAATIYWQVEA